MTILREHCDVLIVGAGPELILVRNDALCRGESQGRFRRAAVQGTTGMSTTDPSPLVSRRDSLGHGRSHTSNANVPKRKR